MGCEILEQDLGSFALFGQFSRGFLALFKLLSVAILAGVPGL